MHDPAAVSGIRLREATIVLPTGGDRSGIEDHCHPWHELVVVLGGTHAIGWDGPPRPAPLGTVFYLAPGRRHRIRQTPLGDCRLGVLIWDEPASDRKRPIVVPDPLGRLADATAWAAACWSRGNRPAAEGLLLAILDGIDHAAVEPALPMVRVRRWLAAHLHERLRLEDLAAVVGISRPHLVRSYAAAFGLSPMRDLRRIRAETARRLLRSTAMHTREVARHCGLRDGRHVARVLRAELGVGVHALRQVEHPPDRAAATAVDALAAWIRPLHRQSRDAEKTR